MKKKRISNRHLSDRYYYAGEHNTATGIRLTRFNAKTLRTDPVKNSEASFSKLADPSCINWFEVCGLTDAEVVTRIVKDFGLHNLDAKDILTPQHVVKIVEAGDRRLLIVLNACYYDADGVIHTEHISWIVAGNVVITFTESDNPLFQSVFDALNANLLSIRQRGIGLLLAFQLNAIIASLADAVAHNEEQLENMEEKLLDISNDPSNMGLQIQRLRRESMQIRKSSLPLKDQLPKLLRADSGIIAPDMRPAYDDLADQVLFITQTSDSCQEIIASLVDLYISSNDIRMNTIMKRLTIVSTLFIPLTFLAGVWGMNFKWMPELELPFGYFFAWIVMIVTAGITWFYMKKRDWY